MSWLSVQNANKRYLISEAINEYYVLWLKIAFYVFGEKINDAIEVYCKIGGVIWKSRE